MQRAPQAKVQRRATFALACAALVLATATGCRKPRYDSSTPEKAIDAMAQMVKDERPELLPTMLWIEPREITFTDGVTEASAIEDVKRKSGDMLAQLWRVSKKLRTRYPTEVDAELAKGGTWATRLGGGDAFAAVMSDPFGWLDQNRSRLAVEDLGDGTATFSIDGKPVLGGVLTMAETKDGWRITFPAQLLRSSEYFPDTREEWAVLAYLMIALENALTDFEHELDTGKFATLSAASERAGRMIAESAVAQGIIYAMMQQNQPGKEAPKGAATGIRIENALGQSGDAMRRQAEQRD